MRLVQVKGLDKVLNKLSRANDKIAAGVARGLVKGGLHLQKKSMEICPVDTGNLRGSSFCRNVGGHGFSADVVVGYTANYAVFVHEDLNKLHGRAYNEFYAADIAAGRRANRGENQQAKFLEKPAREERRTIIRIVQREAAF